MPIPANANLLIDLTVSFTGLVETVSAGLSDTNAPMTWVDDVAIDGLYSERVNLLEGVDTFDPNIIRLMENILALVRDEAEEALTESVVE